MNRETIKRWLKALAFFLIVLAAARFTGCSLSQFWRRRSHLSDIVSAMFPPEWGYAPKILLPLLDKILK